VRASAQFVCADVYEAAAAQGHARFDVVYVRLGALCWPPRLERWAAQAAALVAPAGCLFMHDAHPLSWALALDRLQTRRSYFPEAEPLVSESTFTYSDGLGAIAPVRNYQWNHGLGEIVTALLGQGLHLRRLEEHDWTTWPRFSWLEPRDPGRWAMPAGLPRVPLSFTLQAVRPASAAGGSNG
jgi:hypothetical protein